MALRIDIYRDFCIYKSILDGERPFIAKLSAGTFTLRARSLPSLKEKIDAYYARRRASRPSKVA